MKVKCIKTSVDNPNNFVTNGEMKDYLSIGSIFWVYGISFLKQTSYVYIYNSNHLFEVPLELFEIIDSKVSSEWNVKLGENGDITIWPELFYTEDFLENFSDREPYERGLFEALRVIVER